MWSLDGTGFSTGLSYDLWGTIIDHKVCSGVLVAVLILTLLYIITHQILARYSIVYGKLTNDQQLVVIHHTIEVITLALLFGPMTYLNLSLYFEVLSFSEFQLRMQFLIVFMITTIMMFAFELASRFRFPRPLLVVHHLAAYANTLLPIYFHDTAMMKAATVLTYFITFEVLSFAGLLMYRLQPHNRATPHVIMAGIVVMGLSRPLQVLWIVSTFIASWDYLIVWQVALQLFLTALFTTLQLYSLTIQVKLWRKSKDRIAKVNDEEKPDLKPVTTGSVLKDKSLPPIIEEVAYIGAAEGPIKK